MKPSLIIGIFFTGILFLTICFIAKAGIIHGAKVFRSFYKDVNGMSGILRLLKDLIVFLFGCAVVGFCVMLLMLIPYFLVREFMNSTSSLPVKYLSLWFFCSFVGVFMMGGGSKEEEDESTKIADGKA